MRGQNNIDFETPVLKEDPHTKPETVESQIPVIAEIKSHIVSNFQLHLDQYEEKLQQKSRRILILNTGGTISMFPSDKGYVTRKDALYAFMRNNPYLCDLDYTYFQSKEGFLITPVTAYNRRILYCLDELDELIDSSNMDSKGWYRIAHHIQKNYNNYDSFIILHGTDTMSYTASALSFMFENLNKTVVITGSQVPLSQTRNDGFNNLLNALTIAGHFTIPEVLIVFYDKLLRGNRTQKVDSIGLDSFDSPKFKPLGRFGVMININWDLIVNKNDINRELNLCDSMCSDVTAVKMTPLISAQTFKEIFGNKYLKGLVIETYGAGNMKTDPEIQNEIGAASKKGIVVVNISQCHTSCVEMLYETGIIYEELGVISASDMTIEAAITKLSYLLGKNYDNERIKEEFQRNIRGEMTPRKLEKQFNIESEPFLLALSTAITSEHDIQLNRDLVMPNILCLMSRKNKPIQLNELVKLDINYTALDYDDRSVLHVAAREGSIEVAEHMLKHSEGQIINKLDRWQHSPLFEAVNARNKDMINLLVRYGGKMIAPLNEMTHILMNSVNKRDMEMLELFYLGGVRDFGQFRTQDNRTVGHLAASLNNNQVVNFLRRHGVVFDWNQKDRWGRTPMDEAKLQKRGVQSVFLKAFNTII